MKVLPFLTIRAGAADAVETPEELTGKPGVFALEVEGEVTHLSATRDLGRRAARVAKAVGPTERTVLIHCWRTNSKLQTSLLLYDLAQEFFPRTYLDRLHLRMPWFVALSAQDQFPRLVISNRLLAGSSPTIGPFQSRDAAQLFEERVQSAFSLRRCTDILQPSPQHPGCIYGEIKQCLRPCQTAVSTSEYRAEAALVASFLHDEGRKTLPALVAIRDQAAETTDYEGAAKLHKQIEKLREAMAVRSPIATDVSAFHGVVVVAGLEDQVQLFPVIEGLWQGTVSVSVAEANDGSTALEGLIRTRLDAALAHRQANEGKQLEHLALFARWYFSSWRQGEWLPFAVANQPPYRKVLRTTGKMLRKLDEERAMNKPLSRVLA